MQFIEKDFYSMADLLEIMEILRSDEGCSWDRKQTHTSISKNMIEEAYEVVDAIVRRNVPDLKEELGDVLLQVVFHAQMETEKGSFTFEEVVDGVCKKLVFRHPHVFGTQAANDETQALDLWEAQKKKEKNQQTASESLQAVPKVFPSLMRADKVLHRTKKAGIFASDVEEAYAPLEESVASLYELMTSFSEKDEGKKTQISEKIAQIYFNTAIISQFYELDSEKLLTNATEKFINSFVTLEKNNINEKELRECSAEERQQMWTTVLHSQASFSKTQEDMNHDES